MTLQVLPLAGIPEVRPGDDLAALLAPSLQAARVADGDVVVVTSKIVSKAEGRLVPGIERADAGRAGDARASWPAGATSSSRRPRTGFVCANAGVDASNVEAGTLALLPEDPDALRPRDCGPPWRSGWACDVAVVITDTFGRAWRTGLVNVAIGCAGLPAVVDLRGRRTISARQLEATVVALADEVAAASGLVMAKAARVPAAIVRGVDRREAPDGAAADLLRPPDEDLFRESPLQALHARRDDPILRPRRRCRARRWRRPCARPAPRPRLTTRDPGGSPCSRRTVAKRALLAAMATAWREDLRRDGTSEDEIDRRIAKSDAVLGAAPVLIVPVAELRRARTRTPTPNGRHAEREMFLLSGGAAIQTLLLALHAQGVASCWISSIDVLPAGDASGPRHGRIVVRPGNGRVRADAGGSAASALAHRSIPASSSRGADTLARLPPGRPSKEIPHVANTNGDHRRHRRPPHEGRAQGPGAPRARADRAQSGGEAPQPQHRPGADRPRRGGRRRGDRSWSSRARATSRSPRRTRCSRSATAATKSAGCDAVATTPNYQNAPGTDPSIDHAHIGDRSRARRAAALVVSHRSRRLRALTSRRRFPPACTTARPTSTRRSIRWSTRAR